MPDNDEPGRKYAEEVLGILAKLTPKPIVKVIHLPDLPAHGDAAEYIAVRRTAGLDDTAIRAEIESLADMADGVDVDITLGNAEKSEILSTPTTCLQY